jgi:hypothetical protein
LMSSRLPFLGYFTLLFETLESERNQWVDGRCTSDQHC